MPTLTYIDQDDGPTITVRQDDDGSRWASAMTARWRPVDDVLDGLLQNVVDGNMTCKQREDGEFMFKMTERGTASAEDLVGSNPEMAALWAQVSRGQGQKAALTPTAEKVLAALAGGVTDPRDLAEATGLTDGQVEQALVLLAEVGFIEIDTPEPPQDGSR